MRMRSIQENLRIQYMNELKDKLKEKYFYTNRSVLICRKKDVIIFIVKTRVVNINYLNDFISSIDKNQANQIFNKQMKFIVQFRLK